jgi:Tfp pilus assembly protein PilV
MAQSLCSKLHRARGFTIVEVMVAALVLIVGVVGVAGVVGSTLGNTARSEFMTQSATLATEKLEDLNRYPPSDANVAVTNGTSAGTLASDTAGYFDEVYFSSLEGALEESTTSLDANSNVQYKTTIYAPDGSMSTPPASSTAPNAAGSTVFKRRWIIEQDQPVTGVRRVTVLVTLLNNDVRPPVTFQMSMVRP